MVVGSDFNVHCALHPNVVAWVPGGDPKARAISARTKARAAEGMDRRKQCSADACAWHCGVTRVSLRLWKPRWRSCTTQTLRSLSQRMRRTRQATWWWRCKKTRCGSLGRIDARECHCWRTERVGRLQVELSSEEEEDTDVASVSKCRFTS